MEKKYHRNIKNPKAERKEIVLHEKKQLEIFMHPSRQALIREMDRVGKPITPKFLSDKLGISPSSVQFHMKKLLELGVVELDHTEQTKGITARFYKRANVTVRFGIDDSEFKEEKEILMEQLIIDIYKGFLKNVRSHGNEMQESSQFGDMLTGTVYLTNEEAAAFFETILDFLEQHKQKKENTSSWELGMIAYRMEEQE